MKSIVLGLDVLVAVVDGDNYVGSHTVHTRVKGVDVAFNLRDHRHLRFLPTAGGVFPTDAVNAVVRVLAIGLVVSADM
jgi:hypothetical protein